MDVGVGSGSGRGRGGYERMGGGGEGGAQNDHRIFSFAKIISYSPSTRRILLICYFPQEKNE